MIRVRTLRSRLALGFGFAVLATMLGFACVAAGLLYAHERTERSPDKTREEDAEEDLRVLTKMLIAMALSSAPITLGAAWGGWWLAGRALRPMREAAQRARESQADLTLELPVYGSADEWDQLATEVNSLLRRLRGSIEWTKSFTANAAHELRTPLTALLGEAQVALRRERSAEEYKASLGSIEAELSRLAKLVDGLLALARADAKVLTVQHEAYDLSELILGVAKRIRPRLKPGHQLELQVAPLQAVGDALLTERIVENLLDNAAKYGGARIVVQLAATPGGLRLVVEDNGAGLPERVRSRLFERFNREPSRVDGFGLGLAIAQAMARAQGLLLTGDSGPGGTRFVLEFPLVKGAPEPSTILA